MRENTFRRFLGFLLLWTEAVLCFSLLFGVYYVRSGSMEPAIRTGAAAVILKGSMPGEGDAAVYVRNGITVLHRVREIRREGYIFQGDANAQPDRGVVGEALIEGRVVLVFNVSAPVLRLLAGGCSAG